MEKTTKKATILSVNDFPGRSNGSHREPGVFSMEGCEFPAAFTFNSPGILDGFALGVCKQGKVRIKVNSKIYDINDSTAVIIMPNHIVEPIERTEDFVLKLLVVSLDYISRTNLDIATVKILEDNPCIKVSDKDNGILTDMIGIIGKLNGRNENDNNDQILASMISIIVMKLKSVMAYNASDAEQAKISRTKEITKQFLKLVISNYKASRSTDYYADLLCVSPKYLAQVVRQTTGETPFEWINKIVMIGAKNLIRTKDMSILQISEELNFPNPSFFGRFFKKHTGMTPLEFKRSV